MSHMACKEDNVASATLQSSIVTLIKYSFPQAKTTWGLKTCLDLMMHPRIESATLKLVGNGLLNLYELEYVSAKTKN